MPHYVSGVNPTVLYSKEGSQQGCLTGGIVFAFAYRGRDVLEECAARYPNCLVTAYWDDIHIAGPVEKVTGAAALLCCLAASIGLMLHKAASRRRYVVSNHPLSCSIVYISR
jgi:hypothetical protein